MEATELLPESVFVNLLRNPEIDSEPDGIDSSIMGYMNVYKYELWDLANI
jgi:hypothetical protein